MCRPPNGAQVSGAVLGELGTNEAALLPGAEEAGGRIRRFTLPPRLTEHVRHRTKYVDMPIAEGQAFVFNDRRPVLRVRSLKQFVDSLVDLPTSQLTGHLERHDFSRWLNDVFRDRPLAAHVAVLESRIALDDARMVLDAVVQAVQARYDMAAPADDSLRARGAA